jgi:hypothetical protein
MTVSYPASFPSSVGESNWVLYPDNVIAVSESRFTRQPQIQEYDGGRWVLELSFPAMVRAKANEVFAWVCSLHGRYGTFTWGPALMGDPTGSASGTPVVNGASQSDYTLNTSGWTPSASDVLKAGDLFSIENRLYVAVNDVSADGSGNATIDIWPNARTPANSAGITTSNPTGLFRLVDNAPRGMAADNLMSFTTTVRAVEAL